MRESDFALVPRGDNLFSIRLTESMSFGAIPVILADDWVLPFSELVDWSEFSIVVREGKWKAVPKLLREISAEQRCKLRRRAYDVFHTYFVNITQNINGLMEILSKRYGAGVKQAASSLHETHGE